MTYLLESQEGGLSDHLMQRVSAGSLWATQPSEKVRGYLISINIKILPEATLLRRTEHFQVLNFYLFNCICQAEGWPGSWL